MSRRTTIGLLAASGATMFALVALTHGGFLVLLLAGAAVATGLAAYKAAPTGSTPEVA
jgi:hypothetical protein